MRRTVLPAILGTTATGLTLGAPTPAIAQDTSFFAPANFSEMVQARLPAVVGIIATGEAAQTPPGARPQLPPGLEDFFGAPRPEATPQQPRRALGSGFIISSDGYVVTNNHVIEGATDIQVRIEQDRTVAADLIGTDPATDIALLQLRDTSDIDTVDWGDSRNLEIGEWVVAIGNPFGLGGTVTSGIVSAQSRDINAGPYDDFIQTDAAINSGNSGGPLFDTQGQVIGVNTMIYSHSGGNVGIGFAVPAHVAERIVDDLRDDGTVTRGWLGVSIQPVSDTIAEALGLEDSAGAMINQITDGSPADAANLRPGDVVLSVNSNAVDAPRDLVFAVADLAIGEDAQLVVWRDGAREEIAVEIAQQPGTDRAAEPVVPTENAEPQLGASVATLTPKLRTRLGIDDIIRGVALLDVTPDSPAADAGLARGDVIQSINNTDIDDVSAIRDALVEGREMDRPVLLRVHRNGATQFLAVRLGESDG